LNLRTLERGQTSTAEITFPEPAFHRRAEPLLLPINDAVVEIRFRNFLQNGFAYAAAEFIYGRQTHREIHNVMIEKWNTRFDGMGYCQLIHPHQEMFGNAELHFHVWNFLKHFRFNQMPCQVIEVMRNDVMTL